MSVLIHESAGSDEDPIVLQQHSILACLLDRRRLVEAHYFRQICRCNEACEWSNGYALWREVLGQVTLPAPHLSLP
jgi:hypothetical protein